MARTDKTDTNDKWTFKQMLNAVSSVFRGNGKSTVVVAAGGKSSPPPVEALLARRRLTDKTPGILSRMEEAKNKNMVWNNELEPLLEARLARMFHPENFQRMRLTPSQWTNVMRRIVEDISILYESPAHRYLEEEEQKQTTGAALDEGDTESTEKPEQETEEGEEESAEDTDAEESESEDATESESTPEDTDPEESGSEDTDEEAPPPFPAKAKNEEDEEELPPGAEKIGTGDPDIDGLADVLDIEGAEGESRGPLDEVMELADLDVLLDTVEKLVRVHEAVWVRPFITYDKTIMVPDEATGQEQEQGDPSSGKLTFIVYDPAQADVVENPANPAEALAWYYWGKEINPDGTLATVIHFFTKETYWKFTDDWKVIETAPNLLERLPVTVFRKELPRGSYYCNGVGRDLYEATLEFNILRTIQNARFRDSAFKQLVMSNVDPKDIPADQVMGGPTPIYVPEGGSASAIDLAPNLEQMTRMVEQRALELAATYGISAADYKADGGGPQSGFAKKLDRDKVLKENKRIRKFFAEGEKDLYALLAKTLEVYPIEKVPALDSKQKFCVDFAEPSFEDDPGTQAVTDAQDLKLNKTSIIEILKRENPDLNEVELVKLAYKNKRINEAFVDPKAMKLVDILAHKVGVAGGGGGGGFGGGGGAVEGEAE